MAEGSAPPPVDDTRDYLGVLLLGRTGQGKSTTGNKLLKAGGESVLESCTREVHSIFRGENERVKAVKIVDTPGFAGSEECQRQGVKKANLAMFRDLIRKGLNENLRIHRVLYFLPCRGPLERADGVLQEEIQVMHHFFGKAIFDCMVLVATLYERKQGLGFDDEDKEQTRNTIEKALTKALRNDRPTCPPVLYIGFNDDGADIQHSIESAHVVSNEVLTMDRLVEGTCSRCSAKYLCHKADDPNDPENRIGVVTQVEGKKQKYNKEQLNPYYSSKCHPLFIPKYSKREKVAGGTAHELPGPLNNNEMCVNCKQSPGSDGCLQSRTRFQATLDTGQRVDTIVEHTNRFEDYYAKYLDLSYV